jgi:hypothetical protein
VDDNSAIVDDILVNHGPRCRTSRNFDDDFDMSFSSRVVSDSCRDTPANSQIRKRDLHSYITYDVNCFFGC